MKVLLTSLLLLNLSTAMALTGEQLYKKINCAQCHDKDGMGKAKKEKDGTYDVKATKGPRIAGLDEKYIEEQMLAIQSKKRKTKYTLSMAVKIKKLSPEDIKSLSSYIAKELNPKAGKAKGMLQK